MTDVAPVSFGTQVGAVLHHLAHRLDPGDLAALRRLDPADPTAPAFWRLAAGPLAGLISPAGPRRDEDERRWAAFLGAAARMSDLHRPSRPLGRALAAAGYAELRFVRLVRAQGDGLFHEARTLAHFLAQKGEGANLVDLARLLVSEGRADHESVRRRIARDYYAELPSA